MPLSPEARSVLSRYPNVTVVGAGVIGSSWTALFLAHGLKVVVNDPRPEIEAVVRADLQKFAPTLRALGLPTDDLARHLRFEPDLERAVADADVVQENGPERIEFKQALWPRIERAARKRPLLLSSSSMRTATEQARDMADASRMLIGHPFNPPHLIPLVEVVPGERTEPQAVGEAMAFYEALGKVPRTLRKEIAGFVANRLQRVIFREACYLVREGVVSVDELDDIVTSSVGLRWAVNGPFSSFHLGGGPGGLAAFFEQFGPGMEVSWRAPPPPISPDATLRQLVIDQAAASFGKTPFEQAERERDDSQIAVLRALAASRARDTGNPT